MEQVVECSNMRLAYQRVVESKGAAGVDGVAVSELKDWLEVHWPSVKRALLEGRYMPQPVQRVDVPKPSGGMRTLGVPTVVDRLIQQAVHQVLQPLFEPLCGRLQPVCRQSRRGRAGDERGQGFPRGCPASAHQPC
jgi:retron-type reverse transcriptase